MRREPDVSRRGVTRCHSIADLHGMHPPPRRRHAATASPTATASPAATASPSHSIARATASPAPTASPAAQPVSSVPTPAAWVVLPPVQPTASASPRRRRESGPRIRRHRDAGNRGDHLAGSGGRALTAAATAPMAAATAASSAAPAFSVGGAAVSAAAPAAGAPTPSLAALTPPGGDAPPMAPTWVSTPGGAAATPAATPSANDSASTGAAGQNPQNQKDQPTPGMIALRNTTDPEILHNPYNWSVMVYKSQHRLIVYFRGHLYKEYHAVFGRNLDPGTKLWSGDRRTPEGAYTIIAKRLNSRWRYFLKLDYPNSVDRARYEAAGFAGRSARASMATRFPRATGSESMAPTSQSSMTATSTGPPDASRSTMARSTSSKPFCRSARSW